MVFLGRGPHDQKHSSDHTDIDLFVSSSAATGDILMKMHTRSHCYVAERFGLLHVDSLQLFEDQQRVELLRGKLARVIVGIARGEVVVERERVGGVERAFESVEHGLRAAIQLLAGLEILGEGRERWCDVIQCFRLTS